MLCAACNALGADAQSFPNRPLRFIVGFAPGGSTDIIARLISQKLTEALQQPVVVENRTGANGNIAAEVTAKAPPDGHTMLVAANGLTINPSLYKQIVYNPVKDFSPITQIAFIPNVLVVQPRRNDARENVVRAAGRVRHDETDRPHRVFLTAGVGRTSDAQDYRQYPHHCTHSSFSKRAAFR